MSDGLVIVDKPSGLTSHDVVGRMRRLAHTRRVGHAGTLDPMATGVLVLGVNKATRLLHHLVLTDKAYSATIRLGQSSSTDDAEGQLLDTPEGPTPAAELALDALRAAVADLTGEIRQRPSSVSAIKIDGERAYKRVRDGETVELAARSVRVSSFSVLSTRKVGHLLDVDVEVECSSGTYVRALARDLGAALGVGGHLTALRRTRVGPFTIAGAATLDELALLPDPVHLPLVEAVRAAMGIHQVTADEARALSYGQSIPARGVGGTYGAVHDGVVLALLQDDGAQARPVLVFHAAG